MKPFLSSAAFLVAFWALSTVTALAQPSSGGPAPGAEPTAVPIDGGASLLLAGGVAYGLKQLRTRRQARKTSK